MDFADRVRKTKQFRKLGRVCCLDALGVQNFYDTALSHTVKDIQASVFLPNIWKKWPPFFEGQRPFGKWAECIAKMPWGSKILTKSLYLAPLRRYRHFCVFAENSKWPPFFKRQNFLKIGQHMLLICPGGRKF